MPKFTNEDLTVYHNDNPILRLNGNLAERQGITKEALTELKESHVDRYLIELQLVEASRVEDINMLFKEWTRINFLQQRLWGFPEDSNYHPSHLLSPCICAKMDGDERLGTPYRVVTQGCLIHDPV